MHPAFSVIFFTTASGAGYGLVTLLSIMQAGGALPADPMLGLAGFIVPSKLYGILAAGTPYVAAVEEDSEVADLTARHDSGLVVPPETPEALAKAIVRLYEDSALRARLGANGLAASALHDRPVAVAAYHRLLTTVTGGG